MRGQTPEYDTKTLPLSSQHGPDQSVIRREDRPSIRKKDSPRFLYALNHFPSEDGFARCLLERAGRHLGIAIASMANILFPGHIAIAGGLSAAGSLLLDAVRRSFESSAGSFVRSNVKLTLARLGPHATLIGAAWPFGRSHSSD